MKSRLLLATLTILVFALGLGTGIWTQRRCPLLPPPTGLLGEIREHPSEPHFSAGDPATIAKINAEIERIKPDLDAFRQKLDALHTDFRQKLSAILNPDQREQYEKMHKRHEERRAQQFALPPPSSDGTPPKLPFFNEPVEGLTYIVVVPLAFDYLTEQLKLDDRQKITLHQLLLDRREKFLALIDSTPPPSLRFNRLAPFINKFAAPSPAK